MQYTTESASSTTRKADYVIGSYKVANPYANELDYAGARYGVETDETAGDYDYYETAGYIILKPTFASTVGTKQYVKYTFTVYDDSYVPMAADQTSLGGGENFGSYGTGSSLATGNKYTPAHTVTIFVECMISMKTENGKYVTDGGGQNVRNSKVLHVYNNCELTDNGPTKWVTTDYLYRNAAGAATTDFVMPLTPNDKGVYDTYLGNDPMYG